MARENVMSTPIFDQLLHEMTQRAEARAAPPSPEPESRNGPADQPRVGARRRHRAE